MEMGGDSLSRIFLMREIEKRNADFPLAAGCPEACHAGVRVLSSAWFTRFTSLKIQKTLKNTLKCQKKR